VMSRLPLLVSILLIMIGWIEEEEESSCSGQHDKSC
jgi:hypothetical protein